MVILSLDTTTRAGSCALWRDGALVEERAGDPARTHAERLPGDLADLLAAHGLRVGDVDRYAVASGPGSFTGLRVGIATIQGLALVHGRTVVPVSALEALARCGAEQVGAAAEAVGPTRPTSPHDASGDAPPFSPSPHEAIVGAPALSASPHADVVVGAWMEAYRGEVFGALYRVSRAISSSSAAPHVATTLEELAAPAVASPASLAAEWARAAADGVAVVIGDAVPATRDILQAAWPGARLLDPVPLAAMIARVAHEQPERAVLPHAIVPLYVRRPDAELARDRRADRESCSPTT